MEIHMILSIMVIDHKKGRIMNMESHALGEADIRDSEVPPIFLPCIKLGHFSIMGLVSSHFHEVQGK